MQKQIERKYSIESYYESQEDGASNSCIQDIVLEQFNIDQYTTLNIEQNLKLLQHINQQSLVFERMCTYCDFQINQANEISEELSKRKQMNGKYNIILHDFYLNPNKNQFTIFYEAFAQGLNKEFVNHVKQNWRWREKELINTVKCVLRGLKEMHERDLVHGDLRMSNIVLTEKGEVKLADQYCINFSKIDTTSYYKKDVRFLIATQSLLPPESMQILKNFQISDENFQSDSNLYSQIITKKGDLWALGIILLEMALLENIHHQIYDFNNFKICLSLLQQKIKKVKSIFSKRSLIISLVSTLLNDNPDMRLLAYDHVENSSSIIKKSVSFKESLRASPNNESNLLKKEEIQEQKNINEDNYQINLHPINLIPNKLNDFPMVLDQSIEYQPQNSNSNCINLSQNIEQQFKKQLFAGYGFDCRQQQTNFNNEEEQFQGQKLILQSDFNNIQTNNDDYIQMNQVPNQISEIDNNNNNNTNNTKKCNEKDNNTNLINVKTDYNCNNNGEQFNQNYQLDYNFENSNQINFQKQKNHRNNLFEQQIFSDENTVIINNNNPVQDNLGNDASSVESTNSSENYNHIQINRQQQQQYLASQEKENISHLSNIQNKQTIAKCLFQKKPANKFENQKVFQEDFIDYEYEYKKPSQILQIPQETARNQFQRSQNYILFPEIQSQSQNQKLLNQSNSSSQNNSQQYIKLLGQGKADKGMKQNQEQVEIQGIYLLSKYENQSPLKTSKIINVDQNEIQDKKEDSKRVILTEQSQSGITEYFNQISPIRDQSSRLTTNQSTSITEWMKESCLQQQTKTEQQLKIDEKLQKLDELCDQALQKSMKNRQKIETIVNTIRKNSCQNNISLSEESQNKSFSNDEKFSIFNLFPQNNQYEAKCKMVDNLNLLKKQLKSSSSSSISSINSSTIDFNKNQNKILSSINNPCQRSLLNPMLSKQESQQKAINSFSQQDNLKLSAHYGSIALNYLVEYIEQSKNIQFNGSLQNQSIANSQREQQFNQKILDILFKNDTSKQIEELQKQQEIKRVDSNNIQNHLRKVSKISIQSDILPIQQQQQLSSPFLSNSMVTYDNRYSQISHSHEDMKVSIPSPIHQYTYSLKAANTTTPQNPQKEPFFLTASNNSQYPF